MEYFCPKCGKVISPEDREFYKQKFSCRDCSQETLQVPLAKQYIVHFCSGCLSYIFNRDPKNSQWKRSAAGDINQILVQLLNTELSHTLKINSDRFILDIPSVTEIPSKLKVSLILSGINSDFDLLLKYGLCKICNKMLSRRFDAVIQLRTIKMKSLKPHELLNPLLDEVESHVVTIQRNHPEQFISDIDEQSHGYDLKLSSRSISSSIQSYLTSKYSFIIKTSKKLMGRNPNTGGELYRSYILLRYIPLQTGDIIRIKDDSYRVNKVTTNRIQLENLRSNSVKTRNFEYFDKNLIEIMEA